MENATNVFSMDRRFQLRESSNSLCRKAYTPCPWRKTEEKALGTSMDILKGVVFSKKRKFRAAKGEALNAR